MFLFFHFTCDLFHNPTASGQTDMPVEGLETNMKAITLVEDVSTFDDLRPHLR